MLPIQSTQTQPAQQHLEQLINKIFRQRCISRDTQQQLMQALFDKGALTEREATQVNRMFDAISQGQIRVTD